MDERKSTNDLSQPVPQSQSQSRQRTECEVKDPLAARKVQKADREKLRRDKLNEVFNELGNTLDAERPKNDKATVVTDTIQTLRDLTAEVNRLRAECVTLSEEARELTQEKNELREEKTSLKSEVDNLNIRLQQRLTVMYPWGAIDPSVVMAPPYSYPVALPMPARPVPIHPSMQQFPFFGNQNPVAIPNPCSTFLPYSGTVNPQIDQPSIAYESTSHTSNKQERRRKSLDAYTNSSDAEDDDSTEVVTELELKTPGSTVQQELSPGDRKGKRPQGKKRITDRSCSSSRYSSQDLQKSSSNSIDNIMRPNN